ncbi:MAG: hypothetical protein WCF04_05010 [Candidatus Nanopelagicales bacterium]
MEHTEAGEYDLRTRVMMRSHLERCLQDIWGTRDLAVDDDRDYPYPYGIAACWVSPLGGPVPGVEVYAHAAVGLKPSARLLREVGELNARSRWTKLTFADGIVRVSATLHWAAVDRLALAHTLAQVGEVANDVGSLLAVVYGGSTPFSADVPVRGSRSDEAA